MITLFLRSFKGFSVLEAIIEADFSGLIKTVVIGTDKHVNNDYSSEMSSLCKINNINCCYHKNFDYQTIGEFSIAVSWDKLIKNDNTKLIVLHESLLPKYRGFAPLVSQLLNREPELGVTAFFAVDDYDKGDIIFQQAIPISFPLKISEAIKIVSKYYINISLHILKIIKEHGVFDTRQQNEDLATYSLWRDNEDYLIDWSAENSYLQRFIDAVGDPFLGAQTFMNNERITIHDAELAGELYIENRDYGKVIFFHDKFPVIVCGKGLLKITKAIYTITGESIFPMKQFRVRFKS
jgi:methionyl-tRNA formyltransferase